LRGSGGSTAYATLDNTTRFQWLGQESYEEDEYTNPNTGSAWVQPVTSLAGTAAGSTSTANRNLTVTWTRPGTPTEYKGALVAIFDENGYQVGNPAAPNQKTLSITTKAGYQVRDEAYIDAHYPGMAAGKYIECTLSTSNGSVVVTGLPNGSYDIYVWSFTGLLGDPEKIRYSTVAEKSVTK
jgi:hypothetical protein